MAGLSTSGITIFKRGNKFFELSNQLGNVLVTVSDKKLEHSTNGINVDYYYADIVTANDYYPFGMGMPGRKYSSGSSYRYGFNGKEKSDEIFGEGNAYDYGNRIYDPRTGRWFKPDALEARLPMVSPYHFGLNNPLRYSDNKGDFVIDEATAKAYPQLKPVLSALVAELQKPENEKKVAELVRLGQFKDRQAFFEVLTDGKGPKLSVQNIVNVDIKVTKTSTEVQVPNPLGSGMMSQTQEGSITEYPAAITALATEIGVKPEDGNVAAVTKTVGGFIKEIIETTRGGKVIKTEETITEKPKISEVILDDNTANILNNSKIPLSKDGTINMKKASDALTYFLKVIIHETGHVGDNGTKVPGAAAPGKEIGKESEDSYYNTDKQKNINGGKVLYENKPKG